jgi:N-acyl-D-aspartate/D-glutamate deacylase
MVVGTAQRQVTPEELAQMSGLVDQAMKSGAFGLSSGLEYLGDYVTTEEMIALAKVVAPYGGYYETHLRNEDVGVFAAVEEAIRICREGGNIPLSISHIKLASYEVWHQAGKLENVMDAARAKGLRVYANWRPTINWADDLKHFDPRGERNLTVIEAKIRQYWPNADAYCFKCPSHPEIKGKTLDKIAALWGISPAEALVKTWDFGDAQFEYDSSSWEDRRVLINDPWSMVASDGDDAIGTDRPDPMTWGCYAIFFGRIVREWKWFPVEEAVYKCTGLPAELVGLKDRGTLKVGMKADIVAFDSNVIAGNSHWGEGTHPRGIAYTFVNGVLVMDHGKHTGARPGVFLKRK